MGIKEKEIKLLELYLKALANKKRIKILLLINERKNLSVEEICDILKISYPNGAVHIQRLEKVGFIYKNYKGLRVEHIISARGKFLLNLLKNLLK